MGTAFASGRKALGICDRCGLEFKLTALRSETVKGRPVNNLVCRRCFDEDHPQLMLGAVSVDDPQALRTPRPDNSYDTSGVAYPGSRDIQWGWNPVGGGDGTLTPNTLLVRGEVGNVTVVIS